jgi:hypothetical protein
MLRIAPTCSFATVVVEGSFGSKAAVVARLTVRPVCPQPVLRETRCGVRACRAIALSLPRDYFYRRPLSLTTSVGVAVLALSAAATRPDTASAVARTMSAARST